MPIIRVSAVVLRSQSGHVLTVRKRGTQRFMLPGGKPEPGEDAAATALREVAEEIGIHLNPGQLVFLGVFQAPAANEPDTIVEGSIFTHPASVAPIPAAEIEELRWLNPGTPLPDDLAPLLASQVLPHIAGFGQAGATA